MNLLKETIETLRENKKSEKDVLWCGTDTLWFSWKHFKTIANIEYAEESYSPKIATNLIIVGKNWI